MIASFNSFVCVYLLWCFGPRDTPLNGDDCPEFCECYDAPKPFSDSSKSYISIYCNDIYENITEVMKIKSSDINTFVLDLETSKHKKPLMANYFYDLIISNLVILNAQNVTFDLFSNYQTFAFSKGFRALSFQNANLESYSWTAFVNLDKLNDIYISDCNLPKIQSNFNQYFTKEIISASFINSKISDIHSNAFNKWINLKILTVTDNKELKTINKFNGNFPKLWNIDLSNNAIESLPKDFFGNQYPALKRVNLDGNKLTTLTWELIGPVWNKIKELSIMNNPLCCNKDMKEVIENKPKYNHVINVRCKIMHNGQWSDEFIESADANHLPDGKCA